MITHTYQCQHNITLIYSCITHMNIHIHTPHTYSKSKFILKSLDKIKLQRRRAQAPRDFCVAANFYERSEVPACGYAPPTSHSLINKCIFFRHIIQAIKTLFIKDCPRSHRAWEDTWIKVARAGKFEKLGPLPFRGSHAW